MKNAVHSIHQEITEEEKTFFRLWLQNKFAEKCKKNARFSLRAFAKNLEIDPSSLSQILSGKRKMSKKGIKLFCEKLSACPKEMCRFGLSDEKIKSDEDFLQISVDSFSVISEWYHYAILELTYTANFKADPKWIARKISITIEEAKIAVERLKRLGLLIEENGSLKKSSKRLTNDGSINTSGAHKELQRQIVTKALSAIDECGSAEKDITSMTMAIDTANIERARTLIQKFRRDLCALLEKGEQTCVYNLGIQLYPISKNEENL